MSTIKINGRSEEWPWLYVGYGDVVLLAFRDADPASNYTIRYDHGPKPDPVGVLGRGCWVLAVPGMGFTVEPS